MTGGDMGYGRSHPNSSVLKFVFEFCREKSEKEVKVAMVKLLHWADSSALLERSHVG